MKVQKKYNESQRIFVLKSHHSVVCIAVLDWQRLYRRLEKLKTQESTDGMK